jgi:hypothetical protein
VQHYHSQHNQKKKTGEEEVSSSIPINDDKWSIDRRVTRGVAERNMVSARTSSVFDIPALSNISSLFDLIDIAKNEMLAPPKQANSSKIKNNRNRDDNESEEEKKPLTSYEQARFCMLENIRIHTMKISQQLSIRFWSCLAPSESYPLYEMKDSLLKFDPSSLKGKYFFTPAEDDLLLRGLISFRSQDFNEWSLLKSSILPSKDEQALESRYNLLTQVHVEDTKFKKYLQLLQEKKTRDNKWIHEKDDNKWSHEEDLNLLRGFQTYGERWSLIRIFFTPNRKRHLIKSRWQALIKNWKAANSKGKNDLQQASRFLTRTKEDELPAALKIFLNFLNASAYSKYAALSQSSKDECNDDKDTTKDDKTNNDYDNENNECNTNQKSAHSNKQKESSMVSQTNAILNDSHFEQDNLDDDSEVDEDAETKADLGKTAADAQEMMIHGQQLSANNSAVVNGSNGLINSFQTVQTVQSAQSALQIEAHRDSAIAVGPKASPLNPLWSIYNSPRTPNPITLDIRIPSSSVKGSSAVMSIPIKLQLTSVVPEYGSMNIAMTNNTNRNNDDDNLDKHYYDGINDYDSQQKKRKVE